MQDKVKYDIKQLFGIGMTLVILGIALAFGLQITGDVRDDMGETDCAGRTDSYTSYNATSKLCYNSTGDTLEFKTAQYNASSNSITGVSKIPEKLPTIATVVVAAVIIGILVNYLYARFA
jgi:hypothetical protein